MKRAAILCRVSTTQQQNLRQHEELLALAKQRGFTVETDDIYEDTISGFSKITERKALTCLMDNIRSGKKKYDLVFCWEVSRISRDPDEGQKVLLFFSEYNTPIYIKTIDMHTHLPGQIDYDGKLKRNPLFGIVFILMSELAAAEAEYIRLRSVSGLRSKIKEGHAGGGVLKATGFKNENKILVVDEEEANVVRRIFDYALQGKGLKTICGILNDLGIPTKTQKAIKKGTITTKGTGSAKLVKPTKHIRWEEGTVQSILTNPIYKGERKYKIDEIVENGKRKPVYGTFKVPAIVEPEVFDRVQKLRSEKYSKGLKERRYLYLLKGICTCGICGRNYYGRYRSSKKDEYYQCSSRRHKTMVCGNTGINIEAIDSTVWDIVKHSVKAMQLIVNSEEKEKERKDKVQQLLEEINEHNTVIKELIEQRDKIKKLFILKVIQEDEMLTEVTKIEKSSKARQLLIVKVQRQLNAVKEHNEILSKVNRYNELIKHIEGDRYKIAELISNFVERVVVTSVTRKSNNYRYVVSVWIKSAPAPYHVLLITKQRNQQGDFITHEMQQKSGQNRFKYINGSCSSLIEYTDSFTLKTAVDEVVDIITEYAASENAVFDVQKLQQLNTWGNIYNTKTQLIDEHQEYINEAMVEEIPVLLPFDDANAIDHVILQQKQKKLKRRAA